jgi:hypothetical protein
VANTENIEAKLAAYVDGELDPIGRAEIEQYLTTNPQHRALIEELRSAKDYLQDLPRASAPPEVAEMISQQLERAALLGDVEIGTDPGTGHFSRWPQVRAIAAILILTVGLAGVLYYVLPSPKPVSPEHVAIVTPELPRTDDASATLEKAENLEKARPSGPGIADADARELAMRSAASGASPAGGGGANAVATAAPAMSAELREQATSTPSAQLCVLVNTSDPRRADEDVINYFASNQISYEHIASSEAIANGVKKETDLASPTTAPEMNIAPGNNAIAKEFSGATTNPADETLAANASRKPQSWPAHFKAKMTRSQAANLSEALSQSKIRQVAQVVSPDVLQQKQMSEQQQAPLGRNEPVATQANVPTTNQVAAAMDAVVSTPSTSTSAPAPVFADRTLSDRGEVLGPGDTLRVRVSDRFHAGTPITEETHTVDDDGFVELPRLGRIKAAGFTTGQLMTNIIPQDEQRNRDSQSPRMDLAWTVEKVKPEPATAPSETAAPTTQGSANVGRMYGTIPTTQPTTGPTTAPSAPTALQAGDSETEKLDVVVIVQAAAIPANDLLDASAADGKAPAPTTEPAMKPVTPPTTVPTTSPSR